MLYLRVLYIKGEIITKFFLLQKATFKIHTSIVRSWISEAYYMFMSDKSHTDLHYTGDNLVNKSFFTTAKRIFSVKLHRRLCACGLHNNNCTYQEALKLVWVTIAAVEKT
jgi:hypothetical protein